MRHICLLTIAALFVPGCEDGPAQIFEPNGGTPDDIRQQNGQDPTNGFVAGDGRGFDEEDANDNAGRALFCNEGERTDLVQFMVTQPIIPDTRAGGIDIWDANGTPTNVDDLFGTRADNKFCDPDGPYGTGISGLWAYVWGPEFEVVATFDSETRLMEGIWTLGNYLGGLDGTFTDEAGVVRTVKLKNRRKTKICNELGEACDNLSRYPEWLDDENLNFINRMLRETHFASAPLPDNTNCVNDRTCDVIYADDPGTPEEPQRTLVIFRDSGVLIFWEEDGTILEVDIDNVRVAPFELDSAFTFDAASTGEMNPALSSTTLFPNCDMRLGTGLNWGDFSGNCTALDRTLQRAEYSTGLMRNSSYVNFNAAEFGFRRAATLDNIIRDGERPADTDELFYVSFTRSLSAPVAQFVPETLGLMYQTNLQEMLSAAVAGPFCDTGDVAIPLCDAGFNCDMTLNRCENIGHPWNNYTAPQMSQLSADPKPIDRIFISDVSEVQWIPLVVQGLQDQYANFTDDQKAQVKGIDIFHPATFIHPYTAAVVEQFTFGDSLAAPFVNFTSTDDQRWSIGSTHFELGGEHYRVTAQYSINYGAITAVTVTNGTDAIDDILGNVAGVKAPYYELQMAVTDEAFGVGGTGVEIDRASADRQLSMLTATLTFDAANTVTLPVAGFPHEDESGFTRQVRGERWEFEPADKVYLYGRETALLVYVTPEGEIGRVVQPTFKGNFNLCDGPEVGTPAATCAAQSHEATCATSNCYWFDGGCTKSLDLNFSYGEPVTAKIQNWVDTLDSYAAGTGLDQFRACDIVYNYSENGNVLYNVVSLQNRASVTTVDNVATSAALWQ